MEEKKELFNLEWLNKSITASQELKPIDFNAPLLQQAALKVLFTEQEMKTWQEQATELLGMQPGDLDALFWRSNQGNGVNYSLKDYVRNNVLKSIPTLDLFARFTNETSTVINETQKLFNSYITGNAPELPSQTMAQRVDSFSIAQWLKDTIIRVPQEAEVLSIIKQDEVLQPLRKLTASFRGRQKDLEMLSDYVDWLPKSGFLQKTRGIFRQIINWHEKPPLLITGIGGIGKSTLMAQFILQQVEHSERGRLPFINLDFDRPGISVLDPITLIYEGLRQLIQQFPDLAYLKYIRKNIKEQYFDEYRESSSRSSDRQYLYEQYLRSEQVQQFLNNLGIPILLVFDSFEEVQTRFSQTELDNFFNFLKEITEQIPRLRTVFISRSDYITKAIDFTMYPLGDFDQDAAVGFLETFGLHDTQLAIQLFKQFGGNPLTLQLAGDLIRNEQLNNKGQIENINTSNLFSKIQENRIQEQLVRRNLDHIHNDQVKKIAFPGMVVRTISPEVIREVLAVPCGLGQISIEDAQAIFEDLKRESFLLIELSDGVAFRQELRVALSDLILQEMPEKVRAIHDHAVEFYMSLPESDSIQAEFLYHALMRGDDTDIIDRYYDEQVGRYLNNSLTELPLDAYVTLASRMGVNISEDKLNRASPAAWANYLENEISRSLKSSDFPALQALFIRISTRSMEIDNVPYLLQFAKLAERVGDLELQEGILYNKLRFLQEKVRQIDFRTEKEELKQVLTYFRLILYHAEYAEEADYRERRYKKFSIFADHDDHSYIEDLFRSWSHEFSLMHNDEAQKSGYDWMDLCFTLLRRSNRERSGAAFCIRLISHSVNFLFSGSNYDDRKLSGRLKNDSRAMKQFLKYLPLAYATAVKQLIAKNADFDFMDYVYTLADFENYPYSMGGRQDIRRISNHKELEKAIKPYGKVHLKDICEPGSILVNRVDVNNFISAMNAWHPWRR